MLPKFISLLVPKCQGVKHSDQPGSTRLQIPIISKRNYSLLIGSCDITATRRLNSRNKIVPTQ